MNRFIKDMWLWAVCDLFVNGFLPAKYIRMSELEPIQRDMFMAAIIKFTFGTGNVQKVMSHVT